MVATQRENEKSKKYAEFIIVEAPIIEYVEVNGIKLKITPKESRAEEFKDIVIEPTHRYKKHGEDQAVCLTHLVQEAGLPVLYAVE